MAFLVALEELRPQQRAVLLLRDVLDYSTEETGEILELSQANVKTTLHRARRRLQKADRSAAARASGAGSSIEETLRLTIARMVQALSAGDAPAFAALLADDVRSLSDGGGEFSAATAPVVGRDRVGALYLGIATRRTPSSIEMRTLSGMPALVLGFDARRPRDASRAVLGIVLDESGRVAEIYSVLASRKLCRVA